MTNTEKQTILSALRRFINSRPGLDFANYGDVKSYRSELRRISNDRHAALTLLNYVEHSSLTADQLKAGFRRRLTWDGKDFQYTTGQYYPVEYRAAAARALADAIWQSQRDYMPAHDENGLYTFAAKKLSAGDYLRRKFRALFGRSIQSRFFN
jgi:hypothetical protein